jgi:hypothetical protein
MTQLGRKQSDPPGAIGPRRPHRKVRRRQQTRRHRKPNDTCNHAPPLPARSPSAKPKLARACDPIFSRPRALSAGVTRPLRASS